MQSGTMAHVNRKAAEKAKETKIKMKVMPGAGVPMTLAPFSGVLYDLK